MLESTAESRNLVICSDFIAVFIDVLVVQSYFSEATVSIDLVSVLHLF